MKVAGLLVDIYLRDIYPAEVIFKDGKIERIERISEAPHVYILPGLIDAHIHIESSMITPGAFAETAVVHGTTAVVSDPHEIANVLGYEGVKYMLNDARKVPLKFFFGAPSCVPATLFESSGARLDHKDIDKLLGLPEIKFLSEMMNFPGVIYNDHEVYQKLESAKRVGKPVDGHAPGLSGRDLKIYTEAGISTDHECSTIGEALEKISLGMKILIREGSAARNLGSLKDLYNIHPDKIMLCSDDLHPEMLRIRHINKLIAGLITEGYNIFDVLRSATLNPSVHYGLNAGLLRPGDSGDLIIVDNLKSMNVLETWIDGTKVFDKGVVLFSYKPGLPVNNFVSSEISEQQIRVKNSGGKVRVIKAFDGELLTKQLLISSGNSEYVNCSLSDDILKIVVKDRYNDSPPAIGFINGFGLKRGAIASSVAHDSHNIIAVGSNDTDIINAINEVILLKGGLCVSSAGKSDSLQLDIGGIMTTRSCNDIANDYERLNDLARSFGSAMNAPFMTLSFMALLVIPELKLGDKGLFDVNKFELVSLFV